MTTLDDTARVPRAAARREVIPSSLVGMAIFVGTEVMFFAGLFAAYFSVVAGAPTWPPSEFVDKIHIFPLVGPATVLLILSSFTIHAGVRAIRRNDRTAMNRALAITLALGVTFLVMQVIDYVLLYGEGVQIGRAHV